MVAFDSKDSGAVSQRPELFFPAEKKYPVGTQIFLRITLSFGGELQTGRSEMFSVRGDIVQTESSGLLVVLDPATLVSEQALQKKCRVPSMGVVGFDPLLNDLLTGQLTRRFGASCSYSTSLERLQRTTHPQVIFLDCADIVANQFFLQLEQAAIDFSRECILLFNVVDEREIGLRALHMGVRGLFLKGTSFNQLCSGTQSVLDGKLWYPNEILSAYLQGERFSLQISESSALSEREKEVLQEAVQGFSNKEIAEHLFLSVSTVKTHLYNVYKKTGVKNRVQAVAWAREYAHLLE